MKGRPTHFASFSALQRASLAVLPRLVGSWLPTGRREGNEWLALNPRRADRNLGSFKVNLQTGRWADFATGDAGGDAISLLAYLRGVSQAQAARLLERELRSPL
jgi:hypothetical protein